MVKQQYAHSHVRRQPKRERERLTSFLCLWRFTLLFIGNGALLTRFDNASFHARVERIPSRSLLLLE